jgi:hypothetical protein
MPGGSLSKMVGDEERVVQAFVFWLEAQGWSVSQEVEFCDVVVGFAKFAVVVPDVVLPAVLRVSRRVRNLLGIEVHTVDEAGTVVHHLA